MTTTSGSGLAPLRERLANGVTLLVTFLEHHSLPECIHYYSFSPALVVVTPGVGTFDIYVRRVRTMFDRAHPTFAPSELSAKSYHKRGLARVLSTNH